MSVAKRGYCRCALLGDERCSDWMSMTKGGGGDECG
jgi:hypothetical protein